MILMKLQRTTRLALLVVLGAGLPACGDDDGGNEADATTSATAEAGEPLQVEAAFYPLQWMAEQVGGDAVEVHNLAPPGAEPHDMELTPQDVARLQDADAVVILRGFQPAVDEAVGDLDEERVFDAAQATTLDLTYTPIEEGELHDDEAGSVDPHFWLDPTKLAEVGDAFAEFLGGLDPDKADSFSENAGALREQLTTLDDELEAGLVSCESKDLVTSHVAFGYLANRYGLTQVGITGLTPEDEPSPADLAEVTNFVRENDVKTIYFETLVSPDLAETVAAETGAQTDVLDPIEGLNDESQGDDYPAIMRANLANLEKGQPCP
jgi:zinc transport system substrate-binding protein